MRKNELLIVVMFMIPFNTFADPSPTIRALMGKPVSVFDYGLDKMEGSFKELINFINKDNVWECYCSYYWERNTINVFFGQMDFSVKYSKEDCDRITNSFSSIYLFQKDEIEKRCLGTFRGSLESDNANELAKSFLFHIKMIFCSGEDIHHYRASWELGGENLMISID